MDQTKEQHRSDGGALDSFGQSYVVFLSCDLPAPPLLSRVDDDDGLKGV